MVEVGGELLFAGNWKARDAIIMCGTRLWPLAAMSAIPASSSRTTRSFRKTTTCFSPHGFTWSLCGRPTYITC